MHYHANRVGSPARSSKSKALADARRLRVSQYFDDPKQMRDSRPVEMATIKAHGGEFPTLVRCDESCEVEK